MAKHAINDEFSNGYSLFDSSSTYTVTVDSFITDADGDAITEPLAYSNNMTIMQGVVQSSASHYAIHSNGDNSTIEIARSGVLTGAGYGIEVLGDNAFIHNFGLIDTSGVRALDLDGNNPELVNEAGGVISGRITVNPQEASSVFNFTNHGIANLGTYIGSARNDIIRNDGRIVGDLLLSSGNDTVDTRGGTIRGIIEGYTGDDTLITDSARYQLLETNGNGNGDDTVKSTVSYTLSDSVETLVLLGSKDIDGNGEGGSNTLIGNSGDNTLAGYASADTLDGRGGKDVLNGGNESDTFVFGTGYGKDTIQDFAQGEDVIDLSGWKAIKNAASAINHAEDHGQDTWITSGKDILVIRHFDAKDLENTDFTF